MTPGVSVVLPVRDAAATLGECLASLAAQTLRDHELIAVDDGSRDASAAILAAAAARDRRLRVITTPARGLPSALNTAVALAHAPLLARMDADDIAHPERLAAQKRFLEAHPEVSILGSRVELLAAVPAPGMRAYIDWSNGLLDHSAIGDDLYVESPLVHPSVMLRREHLLGLGGYRDFGGPEDYDLWLRAYGAGVRFAKLREVLLVWRDGPHRLTRVDPRYHPDRFRELKLAALERDRPETLGRVVIWGAGPIGKAWARALRSRGHGIEAFVEVDARKIGKHLHGVPVVAVDQAPARGPALHLAAVGQPGARQRIRAAAARLGLSGRLVAVA